MKLGFPAGRGSLTSLPPPEQSRSEGQLCDACFWAVLYGVAGLLDGGDGGEARSHGSLPQRAVLTLRQSFVFG